MKKQQHWLCFKGTSAGNLGFSHEIWGFSVNHLLNQSNDNNMAASQLRISMMVYGPPLLQSWGCPWMPGSEKLKPQPNHCGIGQTWSNLRTLVQANISDSCSLTSQFKDI